MRNKRKIKIKNFQNKDNKNNTKSKTCQKRSRRAKERRGEEEATTRKINGQGREDKCAKFKEKKRELQIRRRFLFS